MSYQFTHNERQVIIECESDPAKLEVAFRMGRLTMAAIIAATAEASAAKGDMIEMSDTGCVILRDGLRQQWGGLRLYPAEWQTVGNRIAAVLAYCEANKDELAKRGAATKAAKQAAKKAAKVTPAPAATNPAPTAPTASTQPA